MSDQPHHLVTLGLTDRQRALLDPLQAQWRTDVIVDLTADVDPALLLLQVADAAADDVTVLLVGPLVFGFASAGRLRDLPAWVLLRAARTAVIICPDQQDRETLTQASNVFTALRARVGLDLDHPGGMDMLRDALQDLDDLP